MSSPKPRSTPQPARAGKAQPARTLLQPKGNQKKNSAAKMGRIVQRYQGK